MSSKLRNGLGIAKGLYELKDTMLSKHENRGQPEYPLEHHKYCYQCKVNNCQHTCLSASDQLIVSNHTRGRKVHTI